MNHHIRAATRADIPALLDLIHSAYRGERARGGWTHEADLLEGQRTDSEALTAIIGDPRQRILLAKDSDGLAGCVQISDKGDGSAYLGLLSIAPERQAQGLGRVLIEAGEEHARREFGARTMEMTVIRQREELVAYYERRGYVRTGEERPFPLDDPRFGIPKRRDLSFVVLTKQL
jgi:GNAT superfamily N-acetyltransferase